MNKLDKITDPNLLLRYLPLIRGEKREDLLCELNGLIPTMEINSPPIVKENECSHNETTYDDKYADVICLDCGFICANTFSYVGYSDYQNLNIIKKSLYKPIDHLNIILDELCCYRVIVDEELIEELKSFIPNNYKDIKTVRKTLRKLGYKQHYLLLPTIMQHLDPVNFSPIQITSDNRRDIIYLFKQYLQEFYRLQHSGEIIRKNCLNYHFVLLKITTNLNICENIIKFLNPPKGQKTIDEHERIWSLIRLNYPHTLE